jgi:hypothetical protein
LFLVTQLFASAWLALRFPAGSFGAEFFTGMAWQALCILTGDFAAIFEVYQ